MSRPLIADPKRNGEAAKFHAEVFKEWGNKCVRCQVTATDAAHVIPRSQLGKHRYAFAKQNGRPLCRNCHKLQESGVWEFDTITRLRAVKALNMVLKVPLTERMR